MATDAQPAGLYRLLRPALFALPPERAHRLAVALLATNILPSAPPASPLLAVRIAGLDFASPLGLAAGFDKNAQCVAGALGLGLSHVEIGTVTPRPQTGNAKPRVFRLPAHGALINRLGFNNAGAQAAAARLRGRKFRGIVGGNIGRNRDSTDATADYLAAMRTLYPVVDYLTVNVSSPNTEGLRALQQVEPLQRLLEALYAERTRQVAGGLPHRPIFVKLAPDLSDDELTLIAGLLRALCVEAVLMGNTTLARPGLPDMGITAQAGGLSGRPLFEHSTDRLKFLYRILEGSIPIIGIGGVDSPQAAYAKIRAGASLVQLYTGLIYAGYGLPRQILAGLAQRLTQEGTANISALVGRDA